MSPFNVIDEIGERISKTKIMGLVIAAIGFARVAGEFFGLPKIPDNLQDQIEPVVDLIVTVGGVLVIIFRGKKG